MTFLPAGFQEGDEICHSRHEGDDFAWPVTYMAWRKSDPSKRGQGPTLRAAIEDLEGTSYDPDAIEWANWQPGSWEIEP